MSKKKNIKVKSSILRIIRDLLIIGIIISTTTLVLELTIPVNSDENLDDFTNIQMIQQTNIISNPFDETAIGNEVAKATRSGLFKSENSLRDKPMTDRTVETIMSQLELRCIMNIKDGEPKAYVNIKGKALRSCEIGDEVDSLFTVLDIQKDCVEIMIADQKRILKY